MVPPSVPAASTNPSLPRPLSAPAVGLIGPPTRPGVPPGLQSAFNPWDVVLALQRRWLLATVLGLLAAAGAAAGAYAFLRQPQRFYAHAQAALHPPRPLISKPEPESDVAYQLRLVEETFTALDEEVIRRALVDPALEESPVLRDFLDLPEKERFRWVYERYHAFYNEKEKGVLLQMITYDNERWLPPLLNALLNAYVHLSGERELDARRDHYEKRHAIYLDNGGRLVKQLQELHDTQRTQGSRDAEIRKHKEKLLLTSRESTDNEAAVLRGEIMRLQVDLDVELDGLGTATVTPAEVQAELEEDEDYQNLLTFISELEEEIEDSPRFFTSGKNSRYIKELQAELAQMEKVKELYEIKRTAEIGEALAEKKRTTIQTSTASLRKQIDTKTRTLSILDARRNDLDAQIKALGFVTNTTKDLEDQLALHGPVLEQLQAEVDMLERERSAPTRVEAQVYASEPQREAQASPVRKIAMAGFGALALVLGGIGLLEYRTRRIHTAHEVVQGLGLRLLGAIPTWSPRTQQRPGYGTTLAYNFWTESLDTARTMVTHAAQAEAARVVMVTSAVSGEGKTSLASHLASSLARAGHRTLLVDADLRSPAVHALFDLPLGPGLCELLRGEASLDMALRPTPAPGLTLLSAGQWDAGAMQALAQGAAQDVFARLKEQYDYVIVDTSPILAVADALQIGRHVDGVLLSILRDVSRLPAVYAAYQRLTMLGIRTLGAVVSGTREEQYGAWYNTPPTAA